MLQEDLEEGGEGGGKEDEPVLERERGQDDEQDVDTDGEARDAAGTGLVASVARCRKNTIGTSTSAMARLASRAPPLTRRPAQNSAAATSQYAVKSPRFPVHPGMRRTPPRTMNSAKKADTPQTRSRLT
jgi:hypothetical protein